MVVGCGRIRLRLYGIRSLKAKRKIVKSIVAKLQNRFKAAAAETGLNDSHEWADIGFCVVGNASARVNSQMDKIFNFVEDTGLAMVADTNMEIIHL
ncbi:MAG: DUF503 domain-containing protein [Desulfotignum sp.]|jgi:uncharacterized protein YlxP (DUF503 family)|nr:DUF503 domain-containing protein [Desulfotignum sp.]